MLAGSKEGSEEKQPKNPNPIGEQVGTVAPAAPRKPDKPEVVAGGGENRVDAVAVATFKVVASHASVDLEAADDGLDR